MFTSPGNIAFTIGSIEIYWYGIIMAFAIAFGIFTILKIRNKFFKDITSDSIFDLSFELIVFGIIGARLYYVLLDWGYFYRHPFEIPAIWNGGISIQGAIMGGIICGILYAKKHKINFFRYADLYSFGIISGQIIGRWGNFFNSEAFGAPTDLPWKLYIPFKYRPIELREYEFFHPAFLYESLLNIAVLIILYVLLSKCKNLKDGTIFLCYLILYSFVRILIEALRVDSVLDIGFMHIAQITSIVFIVCSIIGLLIINREKKTL